LPKPDCFFGLRVVMRSSCTACDRSASGSCISAMAMSSQIGVLVRRTFIDIVAQQASEHDSGRGRSCSMPPSVGRTAQVEQPRPCLEQLTRLEAIMQGDAVVPPLHGTGWVLSAASGGSSMAAAPSGRCVDGASEQVSWASLSADAGEDLSGAPTTGHGRAPVAVQRSSDDCVPRGRLQSILPGSAGPRTSTLSVASCPLAGGHAETVRPSPCKGKRDRIKKAMDMIERKVAENPDYWNSGAFFLPAFVDETPRSRAHVMAHLSQVAADACRRLAS